MFLSVQCHCGRHQRKELKKAKVEFTLVINISLLQFLHKHFKSSQEWGTVFVPHVNCGKCQVMETFFSNISICFLWLTCAGWFIEQTLENQSCYFFVLCVKGNMQNCPFGVRFPKGLKMSSVNSSWHTWSWHPSNKWLRSKHKWTEITLYLWVPLGFFSFPKWRFVLKCCQTTAPERKLVY